MNGQASKAGIQQAAFSKISVFKTKLQRRGIDAGEN
jgi:hypothetical protein